MKDSSSKEMPDVLYLSIAGFDLKVLFDRCNFGYVKKKFKEDIYDQYQGFKASPKKKIDYVIEVVDKREVELLIQNGRSKHYLYYYEELDCKKIVTFYYISLFQFHLILRKILLNLLLDYQGIVIHSSAVNFHGEVIIFVGPPQAGKSTVIKLLKNTYTALADDSAIIRREKGSYCFYQTHFMEKEGWFRKGKNNYPIKSILFLRKSPDYKIKKIDDKERILKLLLDQFWVKKPEDINRQIRYLFDFVNNFDNFYSLSFAKDKKKLIKLIANFFVN